MRLSPRLIPLAFAAIAFLIAPNAPAQAPGVIIETDRPRTGDPRVLERAGQLREAGALLEAAKVREQLRTPLGGAVDLPKANAASLPGREVAARARAGYVQVGWYYLCTRCDHWHLNLAGSYAIAPDAIATCQHCVEPKSDMREGYLIAVTSAGEALPVTGIIARNQTMDAAILRVGTDKLHPMPLNDQVAPGDAAYCFSEPLGVEGYFSAGTVNRFYWQGNSSAPAASSTVENLRLNVSTDWAPGSSGAAVLDTAANVIGHVARIQPMSEGSPRRPTPKPGTAPVKSGTPTPQPNRFGGATLITLHEAIPARGVLSLVREAAQAPASNPPQPHKTVK